MVELLGGIYTWAEKRELVPGPNPVRGVEKAKGTPKDRVLTREELKALGQAIRDAELPSPAAAACARLIALTGLRREEAAGLTWDEVDEAGSCLRLRDTKTGRSTRPLGSAAIKLLAALPRKSKWLFPNKGGTGSADLRNGSPPSSTPRAFDARSMICEGHSPALRQKKAIQTRP